MTTLRSVLLLFVMVFVCFQDQTNANVLGNIKAVIDITVALAKTWDLVDRDGDTTSLPAAILHKREIDLFRKIGTINSKLDDLSARLDSIGTQSIMTILHNLPETVRLELRLNDLLDYLTRIDTNYRRMQKYNTEERVYERLTLEDFAQSVISHDPNSVINLIERIHAFVVPSGTGLSNTGLFELLSKEIQEVESDMICSINQSPQQVLYSLFDKISLTELKGYIMVQFSYMLLRLYGKGNFKEEVKTNRKRYEERTNNAVEKIRNCLQSTSRDLWKCDPKKHIKGETYEEITHFMQGYIQNEIGFNEKGNCFDECSFYNFTKNIQCEQTICKKQFQLAKGCNGDILYCQLISPDMKICLADYQSSRRYEYIEFDNDRVLGRRHKCSKKTDDADSWYWFFWQCSYCFCICDDPLFSRSDRFFNMRPTISDIRNNKVVTGLRFVKHNRIFHLQIQEGQLLPRLKIDSSTLTWKDVDDYMINDRKIYNGQEYHMLTWNKRGIDLDDLEADDGFVMTGVRFREVGSHLNLQIYTTKFDFETGKLKPEHSTWKDNSNTARRKVRLTRPDIPTRSLSPSIPTSRSDQYIEFTHSDLDYDAAQTAVPFLDAQKVVSQEPVPLAGAGIFHKGRQFYGGFITPKIITYDVSKHIKAAFPSEETN